MSRNTLNNLVDKCRKNRVIVGLIAFCCVFIILLLGHIIAYLKDPDNNPDIQGIFVEAHGLLFDVLLFGVIIFAVDQWRARKERILRYQEEVKDCLGWEGPEAKVRISAAVISARLPTIPTSSRSSR